MIRQYRFWRIYTKELKTGTQTRTQTGICKPIFIATLFTTANRWGKKQVFMNKLIDKQNVVYIYNGILFSLKKEGNSDTCCNTGES